MGYSRIVPRRAPSKQDPDKVERYLKFYRIINDGPVSVWFYDESGFEANRDPGKVIALKGSKPSIPFSGDHIRKNVMGAVNPETGQFFYTTVSRSNTETYQRFLNDFNEVLNGDYCFLIQDNASWHHTKKLNWGTAIPIYLPPYSPNLNAIEELWKTIKDRIIFLKPVKNSEELEQILLDHLRYFLNKPEIIMSVCKISEKIK